MANYAAMNNTSATELAGWIPEIWADYVYIEHYGQMFTEKFTGPEGSGMPIIRKTELLDRPGDTINITQLSKLTGSGVTGSSTLVGNEEKLSENSITVVPTIVRHAVSWDKDIQKKSIHELRTLSQLSLTKWFADKKDQDAWTLMQSTSTGGFSAVARPVVYAGDATVFEEVELADEFDTTVIKKSVNRLEAANVAPVNIEGENYYICLIHPYQKYSLQKDTDWVSAQENANIRGRENPLFTGALGAFGGALIFVTTNCTTENAATSPATPTARAIMLGQEAICVGEAEGMEWNEEVQDYGFKRGVAVEAAYKYESLRADALIQIVTSVPTP